MITLHKHKDDQQAAKIEEKLQDLVLAYRVEEIEGEKSDLFIEDGGEKFRGKEEIETWFQDLEVELEWQRSISGDSCYIHPETGDVC